MTETEAKKSGRNILVGTRQMTQVGRAVERGETKGFMKIVADADTKELLGAALLGASGDEVVHGILDMIYAKAPYTVMQRMVPIHPTVSELLADRHRRHEAGGLILADLYFRAASASVSSLMMPRLASIAAIFSGVSAPVASISTKSRSQPPGVTVANICPGSSLMFTPAMPDIRRQHDDRSRRRIELLLAALDTVSAADHAENFCFARMGVRRRPLAGRRERFPHAEGAARFFGRGVDHDARRQTASSQSVPCPARTRRPCSKVAMSTTPQVAAKP